jgi:hypothetical protein
MIRTDIGHSAWPGQAPRCGAEFSSKARFVTSRKGKIRGQNRPAEGAPIGCFSGSIPAPGCALKLDKKQLLITRDFGLYGTHFSCQTNTRFAQAFP